MPDTSSIAPEQRPAPHWNWNAAGSAPAGITADAIAATSSFVNAFVFSGRTWSSIRNIGATPPERRTSVAPLSAASFMSRSMAANVEEEAEAVLMPCHPLRSRRRRSAGAIRRHLAKDPL